MEPKIFVDLPIDKDVLEMVLASFRYMRDTPGVLDYYKPSVPPPDRLVAITRTLEEHLAGAALPVISIPMTFAEWVDFCSFLHCASEAVLDVERSDFSYYLSQRLSDWEDANFVPALVVLQPVRQQRRNRSPSMQTGSGVVFQLQGQGMLRIDLCADAFASLTRMLELAEHVDESILGASWAEVRQIRAGIGALQLCRGNSFPSRFACRMPWWLRRP